MTIICASSWKGEAWIGCDSAGTDGWGSQFDLGSKIVEYDWGAMGFSGSYRVPQAIASDLRKVDSIETAADADRLVEIIESGLTRVGWQRSKADGLPECKELAFLFVSVGGRIWKVHGDLAVLQFKRFASIGSGYQVADGAMYVAHADQFNPEAAVRMALTASTKLIATCGGRMHRLQVR